MDMFKLCQGVSTLDVRAFDQNTPANLVIDKLTPDQKICLDKVHEGLAVSQAMLKDLYSGVNKQSGCLPKLGLYTTCLGSPGPCAYAWLIEQGWLFLADVERAFQDDDTRRRVGPPARHHTALNARGLARAGFARTCGMCCRAVARVRAGAPLRARTCLDFLQDVPELNPTVTHVLKLILSRNFDIVGYNAESTEHVVHLDDENWVKIREDPATANHQYVGACAYLRDPAYFRQVEDERDVEWFDEVVDKKMDE
jgi:hypothetical protein